MINVLTLMNNSENTIDRFFRQLDGLDPYDYNLFIGEGDSTDKTKEKLECYKSQFTNLITFDVTHGGKLHGSVINSERYLQLAYAGNIVWYESLKRNSDMTLWIDADLIFTTDIIKELANNLSYSNKVHVVAPKIILHRNKYKSDTFYDTFAFRANGLNLRAEYPYSHNYPSNELTLMKMDSVGGMVAMFTYVANQVYFPARYVFVDMCANIRKLGYSIYMNPKLEVIHE